MSAPRSHNRLLVAVVLVATVACGFVALTNRGGGGGNASAAGMIGTDQGASNGSIALTTPGADAASSATTVVGADAGAATTVPAADGGDLVGNETTTGEPCTIDPKSLGVGDSGASVTCLQQALTTAGFYTGAITGAYDQATYAAVEQLQTERDLYVDGVAGRESAKSLGIWPDETLLVIHTPKPAPGAVDLMGYPLSSVASAGADAPPLPADSGSGRRLVYERVSQRVWAVDADGRIVRSWLVAGSKYNNEMPGVHEVYSKSIESTAWNGKAILPKMVRWLKTQKGAIGFHGIPIHVADGTPYMTEDELGQRLSGGCQRQADLDAAFTWDFADIGTPVIVL